MNLISEFTIPWIGGSPKNLTESVPYGTKHILFPKMVKIKIFKYVLIFQESPFLSLKILRNFFLPIWSLMVNYGTRRRRKREGKGGGRRKEKGETKEEEDDKEQIEGLKRRKGQGQGTKEEEG